MTQSMMSDFFLLRERGVGEAERDVKDTLIIHFSCVAQHPPANISAKVEIVYGLLCDH